MRTWIIMACVSCAAASGSAWSQQSGQAASGPKMSVDTTSWDFGEVWAGEKLEKTVVIKNVGDAPLEIQKPKSSCGCTVPSEPKSPLMPGESTTMLIKYNGIKLGDAHQTVTLNSNDSAQPSFGIGVQGKIKPLYEITQKDGLILGQLLESSRIERTLDIVNKYTDKMHLTLKPDQKLEPFQVELKEIDPGTHYQLTVRTLPPLKVGRFDVNAVIQTKWERMPEITEQIYAFVGPAVQVMYATGNDAASRLMLSRKAVMEQKIALRLVHALDHPADVVAVRAVPNSIKIAFEKPAPDADGKADGPTSITVTLPPADQISDDVKDPHVEIETNSKTPEYRTLKIPVVLIPQKPAPAAATTSPVATGK